MAPTKDAVQKNPLHHVSHHRQRWDWDCGVSCVLMLLSPAQREYFLGQFQDICAEEGLKESIWTIDLCYLLKRFTIKHRMFTTMAGVNEDYRSYRYYSNVIDVDRARVEARFKMASACGIDVRERHLTVAQLILHLSAGPAILLVDAGVLACDLCKHNKLKSEFRSCFGGSYKGHYILVVGHSRSKILYRDPALSARLCVASRDNLRRAASATGTDDDCVHKRILVISSDGVLAQWRCAPTFESSNEFIAGTPIVSASGELLSLVTAKRGNHYAVSNIEGECGYFDTMEPWKTVI